MTMTNGPVITFDYAPTLDVSIVIPVHKKREGLKKCIESVLPQLRDGMELIVAWQPDLFDHEGAEIMGIDAIQERFDDLWKIVKVLDEDSMAGNWNKAVSLCRGKFIHLLHDDDYVEPRFYESLMYNLPPDAGVAATGYRNVDPKGKTTLEKLDYPVPIWPALAVTNHFTPVSYMVHRSVYEQLGGYSTQPGIHHCTDWEFLSRAAMRGVRFHTHREILAVHTEGGEQSESAAPYLEQMQAFRTMYAYMKERGVRVDAIIAGLRQMQTVVMRRSMMLSLTDAQESLAMYYLAINIERQVQDYMPKGETC